MTVLDGIIEGVRAELTGRRAALPEREMRELAAAASPPLPAAELLGVKGRLHVIAEVKRASPSRGALAPITDPGALAVEYEAGGATAVSVLTERRRFGGSVEDLAAVRARVSVPVLCKDFVVEPYQLWEARAHGADLVLLIVAALDGARLTDLLAVASGAGLTPLVEVHDEAEVDRALAAGARVIGVNARDLRTLEVDPTVFGRLAPRIPADVVRVAESGIASPADAARLREASADAVLVGESLVTSGDPRAAVAGLIAAGSRAGCPGSR
ncbi:indole-3-glycerol phosphate synthase TrpC [Streptomyces sp. NPDC012600]|uniref:indole-3-glycerol phosphate synthase TrpC n=1 Tax=Streptomyces sp. NPDC012600 TaxID=3415005 RepID=UPI003C2ADE0A